MISYIIIGRFFYRFHCIPVVNAVYRLMLGADVAQRWMYYVLDLTHVGDSRLISATQVHFLLRFI